MNVPSTTEIHLGLEGCGCPDHYFFDEGKLIHALEEAVVNSGLKVVRTCGHRFGEGGVTGVVLLAESHVNAHAWPECGKYMAIDISVCNYSGDNSSKTLKCASELIRIFKPEKVRQNIDFTQNMTEKEYLSEGFGFFYDRKNILKEKKTPYQKLEIFENQFLGRTLKLDNYLQTSEKDEFLYHEPIAHVPLLAHPSPSSVLIIGGGDGGTAAQVLKHKCVKKCVLVDIDEDVINLSRELLPGVHKNVFDDKRLEVRPGDGLSFLKDGDFEKSFDAVILDLSDPTGAAGALYEKEFYSSCAGALKKGGVFALHTEYPFYYPEMHGRIVGTLENVFCFVRPFYNHVPTYGAVMGFAVCSDAFDAASLSGETVECRITEREVSGLKFINGETFFSVMAQPAYVKEIYKSEKNIITSGNPLGDIDGAFNNNRPVLAD